MKPLSDEELDALFARSMLSDVTTEEFIDIVAQAKQANALRDDCEVLRAECLAWRAIKWDELGMTYDGQPITLAEHIVLGFQGMYHARAATDARGCLAPAPAAKRGEGEA